MQQHERLIKETHDHLAEASGKYKAALTRQVRLMEKHNDSHAVIVEATETLATTAGKRFRDIILGEDAIKERFDLEASREARKGRKSY
jgi:hypothetical protein